MQRDRAHNRHTPVIHTVANLPTIDRTGANGRQEALPISFVNRYVRARTFSLPRARRMNVANRIALEPRASAAYIARNGEKSRRAVRGNAKKSTEEKGTSGRTDGRTGGRKKKRGEIERHKNGHPIGSFSRAFPS